MWVPEPAEEGTLKVSLGPSVCDARGAVSVRAMLLGKVAITFGHTASKPGSLSSQRFPKLPRVCNTFLSCLSQLALFGGSL